MALPMSGPASPETIADHLETGRRRIAQAIELYPELAPEDALARMIEGWGPLAARTVGHYRADLKYALAELMQSTDRADMFPVAFAKVDAVLTAKKAKIPFKDRRTSAKKVIDATDDEARALFYELKRHALKYGNPNAVLAALIVLVAAHSGFRPIELRGAGFDGRVLTLPNAKKRPGQAATRALDVSALHKDVLVAIELLLSLIDHDLTKKEFASWTKCIASQITRACERINIRALSLYSFRHVAIATWSAAGLSPEEIARLCGHLSIRTAHAYYARASVGHKRKAVARAALSPQAAPEAKDTERPFGDGHDAAHLSMVPFRGSDNEVPEFIVEAFPEMPPKGDVGHEALSPEDVRRHWEALLDPRDPNEIAANLERARRDRALRNGRTKRGEGF